MCTLLNGRRGLDVKALRDATLNVVTPDILKGKKGNRTTVNMPNHCCVFGCTNNATKDKKNNTKYSYYKFPTMKTKVFILFK